MAGRPKDTCTTMSNVEVSNPDEVLFPDDGITEAEMVTHPV